MEAADLVTELRGQAERDPRLWPDLARGLDHLAEILERSHRLEEASRAAGASTPLRRETGDPRQAFDLARSALAGGDWPDGARALLRRAAEITAPGIRHLAEGQALIGQEEIARHRPGLPWPRRLALQHRIRRQGQECLRRLDFLDDPDLPRLVAADGAGETARLWAMLG
ncbi:MAG: hypothetical protein KJ558_07510 [Gammaproteobacteria bacterium]|nr:hypothetical protein [Gammaproteobacteria bacterium]MBU1654662.1 hypothetical protein [Gammaproteobacteria bacterium]MBU1961385.1 hypothetical protein [Gammaproteobacteria bacterium]